MLFDRPAYSQTLHWLGAPHADGESAWIERPVAGGRWDARGSWPYGSLPDESLLAALLCRGEDPVAGRQLLTWTGVVRPDAGSESGIAAHLRRLADVRPLQWRVLKNHLAHMPEGPGARVTYSRRTRRRLRRAEARFDIVAESIAGHASALADWQEEVRRARDIPRASSPDAAHFTGLEALGPGDSRDVCLLALRRRRPDHRLCGGLIAVRSDDPPGWHAHSALCDVDAREEFGGYLLFDQAIDLLGTDPIWLGGQPGGPAGAGVWRFKRRFANHSAPAHLLSIDLDPDRLRELRAGLPTFPWLPDYRDPAIELKP